MISFYDRDHVYAPNESLEGIGDVQGFKQIRANRSQVRNLQLMECAKLWEDVIIKGKNPVFLQEAFHPGSTPELFNSLASDYPHVFREEMVTGSFGSLTDQILDRALLANFQTYEPVWKEVAKADTNVKDFRSKRLYAHEGMGNAWDQVIELEGFNRRKFSESAFNYSVNKFEAGAQFSWEAAINDDLGIFQDLPERLARGGFNSIERFVTGLYVDASGPHASFYTSGNLNIVTSNAALSLGALTTAMGQMMAQVDAEGNPIVIKNFKLVVGPALNATALNLKNMVLGIDVAGGGSGTSASKLRVSPWIPALFTVVMNPWIPLLATTANAATTWFLFAEPSVGRPALQVGFLRGFEAPQMFKKASNTLSMGGGIVQEMGDFDIMAQEYKGLLVYGGTRIEPKMTMGSNGSGS